MLFTKPEDSFLDQATFPRMKAARAVRNRLAWLTASVMIAGVSSAQDKVPLIAPMMASNSIAAPVLQTQAQLPLNQAIATNVMASISLPVPTEPTLTLGSGTRVSGLFVDLIKPQQSWVMLNPPKQARYWSEPIPRYLLPLTAPSSMDEKPGEPDFALFRFDF